MQIPNVQGQATDANHQGWIPLEQISWRVKRNVRIKPGVATNRESAAPAFSELVVMKNKDASSVQLFEQLCKGGNYPQVTIDVCSTGDNGMQTYSQYVLTNVMITYYEDAAVQNTGNVGMELIALNFTKIQKKFIPYDKSHSAQSPQAAGYDLASAQLC
jgi:type VI secretion system secreted protein Hcp